jgi:cbb3-type cytochrome oxidase subunit 3
MLMTYEAARTFSSWFGLILFMALFIGVVFWAFRPKNKQKLENYGSIPLRDDDDDERVS